MRKDLRKQYLSTPRYQRYLTATKNDDERARKLYHANVLLSQGFHPLISQFEVVFRNGLDSVLTRHFMDFDWITNQKGGFMSDQTLSRSNFFLLRSVENVEAKLRKTRSPLTSGKVISDQTFGFWIALFAPMHYRLINGQPIHVFGNKPSIENRASIYGKLEAVREFRNRVNHCEPLCFNANRVDCSYAVDMRVRLFDLIYWMEPALIPFFEALDSTQGQIDQILTI